MPTLGGIHGSMFRRGVEGSNDMRQNIHNRLGRPRQECRRSQLCIHFRVSDRVDLTFLQS